MLTGDVKRYAEKSVLCWLATASSDGLPNVSPKEAFAVEDDHHLLIANIMSPESVRNIRANPQVCVSFIDVFVQKGFKLKGRADLIPKDHPDYEAKVKPLKALVGDAFPIHAVISVEVNEVQAIIAPSYKLFPDTTEEKQIETSRLTYGVTKHI